jgi:hypothetical protein
MDRTSSTNEARRGMRIGYWSESQKERKKERKKEREHLEDQNEAE